MKINKAELQAALEKVKPGLAEDGFSEAIKVGNFEYDMNGMKKREQLE